LVYGYLSLGVVGPKNIYNTTKITIMVRLGSQGNWKQAGGMLGGQPHYQRLCGDEYGEGISKFGYQRWLMG